MAEPSSVGESGQRGRRARSPKLPRKRANTIRYVLMSSEAGQERGHARRHVVPRDDSRVNILGVRPGREPPRDRPQGTRSATSRRTRALTPPMTMKMRVRRSIIAPLVGRHVPAWGGRLSLPAWIH